MSRGNPVFLEGVLEGSGWPKNHTPILGSFWVTPKWSFCKGILPKMALHPWRFNMLHIIMEVWKMIIFLAECVICRFHAKFSRVYSTKKSRVQTLICLQVSEVEELPNQQHELVFWQCFGCFWLIYVLYLILSRSTQCQAEACSKDKHGQAINLFIFNLYIYVYIHPNSTLHPLQLLSYGWEFRDSRHVRLLLLS